MQSFITRSNKAFNLANFDEDLQLMKTQLFTQSEYFTRLVWKGFFLTDILAVYSQGKPDYMIGIQQTLTYSQLEG